MRISDWSSDVCSSDLPGIQRVAPPGLKVFNQFDVAHFVNASIDEVTHTLIEAILIVVVVIFLFLGSLRAVLIPVVTIPLSLVGSAALMLAFGFRSEERRVGKECVGPCRSRWTPYLSTKK